MLLIRRKLRLRKLLLAVSVAALAWLAAGCAVSRKHQVPASQRPVPRQSATKEELIARFNRQAEAIKSLNAKVTMKLTAGSAYTGVIEEYHEVDAFILAQRPASIRVIGQAPVVGPNIFDMVSDGQTFHIFIPSKHKFLEGSATLEHPAAKPIENLRPQHLTGALFWTPIPPQAPVLIEEQADASMPAYYVLTVVRPAGNATSTDTAAPAWEIASKVWFDRADLNVARLQTFEPEGKVASDARYSNWEALGAIAFPRSLTIARPANDYELRIQVTKLTLNETVSADRFVLAQPPGTELVRVGEEPQENNPQETKP